MFTKRISFATLILLVPIAASSGCASTRYWPFASHASRPTAVENQASTSGPPAIAPAAASNDPTQQIAAESKALSGNYSPVTNPELEKYANIPDDPARNPPRSGSLTSGLSWFVIWLQIRMLPLAELKYRSQTPLQAPKSEITKAWLNIAPRRTTPMRRRQSLQRGK